VRFPRSDRGRMQERGYRREDNESKKRERPRIDFISGVAGGVVWANRRLGSDFVWILRWRSGMGKGGSRLERGEDFVLKVRRWKGDVLRWWKERIWRGRDEAERSGTEKRRVDTTERATPGR